MTFPQSRGFFLIDDGPIADHFLAEQKRAVLFDPNKHSFNPLKAITYQKARQFASTLYGSEGKDTLTVRNGKRALARAFLNSKYLDKLTFPERRWGASKALPDDELEAQAMVDDILLSPLLRDVFTRRENFSFKPSSIVAKLNRAQIGDYDAFILGSILISQFKGQIIIPDFGFYARDLHASLIREDRLIAGLYTLSELPENLRQLALLMPKEARQCTYDDAAILARYRGLEPGTNEYKDFIAAALGER